MRALRFLIAAAWVALFTVSALASLMLLRRPLIDPLWYLHCAPAAYQLIDFSQFYQAGQLAVSPSAHAVYDSQVQQQWAAHLIAPCVPDKIFYNQSVPFLYVLLVPFGLLPYNQAYVVWCLVTMVLALAALYTLLAKVGYLRGRARFLFLAGVVASLPAYLTIWHGQTAFLLTAAFAVYALALILRRDLMAGAALALTTFKPQYLFPFMAMAAGLGRPRVIIGLLLAESILMAAAALFIGPGNILGYPAVLAHAESSSHFIGVNPHYMVSIRGLLSTFLPHRNAMIITIAALVLALGPLFMAARSRQSAAPEKTRWLICITFLVALIVSPHSHYFDCLLLAVPAALTLKTLDLTEIFKEPDNDAGGRWYRWWCAILVSYPLISWPINFLPGGQRELEGMLFLAINSLLLFLACRLFWQKEGPA